MNRAWPALIGAMALAVPVGPTSGRILTVALCGQPDVFVEIPLDDAPNDSHDCCPSKICHAGCERKRRQLSAH